MSIQVNTLELEVKETTQSLLSNEFPWSTHLFIEPTYLLFRNIKASNPQDIYISET